jgi:hypothetical protein
MHTKALHIGFYMHIKALHIGFYIMIRATEFINGIM